MINLSSIKFILYGVYFMAGTAIIWMVSDYINVKSAYKIAQKQIVLLEHRRQQMDIVMVKMEKKTNDNFELQQKALLQIDRQGFISTSDHNNPTWMREYSKGNK